jgi:hypothetical protein
MLVHKKRKHKKIYLVPKRYSIVWALLMLMGHQFKINKNPPGSRGAAIVVVVVVDFSCSGVAVVVAVLA